MVTLIDSKKEWVVSPEPPNEAVTRFKKEIQRSEIFAKLCLQRGLATKEAVDSFIHTNTHPLHSGEELGEMTKAIARINTAIQSQQKIVVYGDYDADGVTSTAILVEALNERQANVDYVIPNRFVHGYGPNVELFQEIIDSGAELILTCDNGISGFDALAYAKERHVDVIVTDHHEIPNVLPPAYAIVHPRLPGYSYPFDDLSGAGVAYKVASVLLEREPEELLELAAIGTIADLVSLTDENRSLVKRGLERLQTSKRPGLQALFDVSNEEQLKADEGTVGFSLGPRINASGRLAEASLAVQLLLTTDAQEATELALHLNRLNEERKGLVETLTQEALAKIAEHQLDEAPILIVAGQNWHEGVLGIVASRLVESLGKPTFVLNIDKEKNVAKGSGRSVQGISLYELVLPVKDALLSFGGHHMAAGISLSLDKLADFTRSLNELFVQKYTHTETKEKIHIDLSLSPSQVSLSLIEELQLLGPFGTGNGAPVIQIQETRVQQVRQIGADESHLKMILSGGGDTVDAIGFGMPNYQEKIGFDATVTAVGTLGINEWRNNRKPQLILQDIATEGTQYFDVRSAHLLPALTEKQEMEFVFFDAAVHEQMASTLPRYSWSQVVSSETVSSYAPQAKQVVFVDCPPSLSLLEQVMANASYTDVYMHFRSEEEVYLTGMPKKDSFATLYRYLATHPNIPLLHIEDKLSSYLNIEKAHVTFMVSVFFEANFVTIENGLISPVENPMKTDLTQMDVYKQREAYLHSQKVLQYSSFSDIVTLFKNWS